MKQCDQCGATFTPRQHDGTWYRVTGWVVDRTEQGLKANAVREKAFTGEARCPPCGRLAELGVMPGQGSLL